MDLVSIYSSVKPEILRFSLLRGTFLAGVGVLILAITGSYIPPTYLQIWGLPILFVGMGLIAWGLIPYRRLLRREANPDALVLTNGKTLEFFQRGEKQITIPLVSIQKIEPFEKDSDYGIGIQLKEPPPEKILVHTQGLDIDKLQLLYRKNYGYDLYFHYFTRRAFSRLAILLEE